MDGIGLVLAGGGGRGAYQIGVWKYLWEQGLDRYVRGVSGTSVGGLNAALFAAGDYETAEKVWLNISPDKLLSPKEITFEDVARWAAVIGVPIQQEHKLNNAMLRQQDFESSYHDKYEALKAIKQGQASDSFDQLLDKLGGKG